MKNAALTFTLVVWFLCPNSFALVIRHDVSHESYEQLATNPDFQSFTPGNGGGTLVAPGWILTCGHGCSGEHISFHLETRWQFSNGEEAVAQIANSVRHPLYPSAGGSFEGGYDMALLKLDEPVFGIQPATRYSGSLDSLLGKEITFVSRDVWKDGLGNLDTQPSPQPRAAGTNTIDSVGQPSEWVPAEDDEILASHLLLADMDSATGPVGHPDRRLGSTSPTALESIAHTGDSGSPWFVYGGAFNDIPMLAAVHTGGLSYTGILNYNYGTIAVGTSIVPSNDWMNEVMGGVNWNHYSSFGYSPFHDPYSWGDGQVPVNEDVRFSIPNEFGYAGIRLNLDAAVRDMTVEYGAHEFLMGENRLDARTIHVDEDGILRVESGGLHASDRISVGETNPAELRVHADGELTSPLVIIGNSANATMIQHGVVQSTDLRLGNDNGTSGSYDMSGIELAVTHDMYVGYDGHGFMAQHSGNVHTMNRLQIGYNSTGSGIYSMNGGTMTAGELRVGNAGAGEFVHNEGSVAVDASLKVGGDNGISGIYRMQGGTLNVLGSHIVGLDGNGTFRQNGGSVSVGGNLIVGQNPTSNGIYNTEPSSSIVVTNGFLVGFGGVGTFTMNDGSVEFGGSGIIGVQSTGHGTLNQIGGSVKATDGHVTVGRDLNSTGVYNMTGGTLSTTGTLELYIGDKGQGTLHKSGGWTSIAGRILLGLGDSGDGTLIMSGNSVLSTTELRVGESGTGSFVMSGGSAIVLGDVMIASNATSTGSLTISGGQFFANRLQFGDGAGSLEFSGGTLHVGVFEGNLTNEGGILSPGSQSDPIGSSQILGDLNQQTEAVLEIEIVSSSHDSVVVESVANLEGDLVLSLLSGTPANDDIFTILNAESIMGSFDNIASGERLQTEYGTGSFLVHYGAGSIFDPTEIVLSDFEGTDPWLRAWKQNYGSQGLFAGDFDMDFDVDGADFLVWQRGLVSSGMLANSTTVPEPSSCASIMICVLLAIALNNRDILTARILN